MNDSESEFAAELARLRAECADAAVLRRAFNKAAETFPGSVTAFLSSRGPTGEAEAAKLMAWWALLYEAIRDTTAGLKASEPPKPRPNPYKPATGATEMVHELAKLKGERFNLPGAASG